MAIEDQINTLVELVDDLVETTTTKRVYFDAQISTAEAAAEEAAATISTIEGHKNQAKVYRDEAAALYSDVGSVTAQDLSSITETLGYTGVVDACRFGKNHCVDPRPWIEREKGLSYYAENGPSPDDGIAAIVDSGAAVKVISLDSGSPVEWMTFSGREVGDSPLAITAISGGSESSTLSSICFSEGSLFLSGNGSAFAQCALIWDFAGDRFGNIAPNSWSGWAGTISERNTLAPLKIGTLPDYGMHPAVNNIVASVRDDAVRDPVSGMLRPTILLGVGVANELAGGRAIINSDYSVLKGYGANHDGGRVCLHAAVDKERIVSCFSSGTGNNHLLNVEDVTFANTSAQSDAASLPGSQWFSITAGSPTGPLNLWGGQGNTAGITTIKSLDCLGSEIAIGRAGGLTRALVSPDGSSVAAAYISTALNSGVMFEGTIFSIGGMADGADMVDRSIIADNYVLGNDAIVTGSVTKTAIGPEGDAHWLELGEPARAVVPMSASDALDGDFIVNCTFRAPTAAGYRVFWSITDGEGTGYGSDGFSFCQLNQDGTISVRTGSDSAAFHATPVIPDIFDGREHAVAIVRSDGVLSILVDGASLYSVANSKVIGGDGFDFVVGSRYYNGAFAGTAFIRTIALAKSAPSPDLIKWAAQREFAAIRAWKEGAKACLHGAADDVQQVAYDPVVGKLHLSTSTNKQVMQGLAVVDWSETSAAIVLDAYNGETLEA